MHCLHIHHTAFQHQLERGLTKYMLFTVPPSLLQYLHFRPAETESKDIFPSSEVTQEALTALIPV